jgi:dolichol kinase
MSKLAPLPVRSVAVPSPDRRNIGAQEFRRRLWHFFPGVLAFAIQPIPHRDPIRFWMMLIIIALGILLPGWAAIRFQRAYRRHPEEDVSPSLLGYIVPVSLLCLLFRGAIEIPLAVTAIIAFGDGTATLVGLLTRGPRIPWNRRKSWAGTCSFILAGFIASSMLYWLEATPAIPLGTVALCLAPVVVICAMIETLPLPVNDNISVGLSASILLLISQTIVVGWH